jgi:hypothetical protein
MSLWSRFFSPPGVRGSIQGHGLLTGLAWWEFALQVPYPKLPLAARRLAELLGAWLEAEGQVVGWVGVYEDEPPKLLAFAPKQDLLAKHFLMATVENPGHLLPQLWLVLAPGTFLAQVVDPESSPPCGREALGELALQGGVRELVFLQPRFARKFFSLAGMAIQPRGKRKPFVRQLRQTLGAL